MCFNPFKVRAKLEDFVAVDVNFLNVSIPLESGLSQKVRDGGLSLAKEGFNPFRVRAKLEVKEYYHDYNN